ncbi:MAG: pyridoxal phosphate-dependent aminotransferase [Desulfurococcales archaeon]|nr:pyridoxal phosphate-dependent aminotransferase [Desulfurococcales archaeon]
MRKISERIKELPLSPHRQLVAKVDELKRQGRTVYNYSAGQPGLPPDQEALKIFYENVMKNPFDHFRYMGSQGLLKLREAISEDLRRYGGIEVNPDNIAVVTGGIDGIILTLYAITDPGDEILLFDPCYSMYWGAVKFLKLKPKACRESVDTGFQPDPECIKELVSNKTAAIFFASPDNPTSRVISEEVAKTVADLAVERKIWIIYDVAYKHIIYEGHHIWMEKYVSDPEILINIASFSKDIAIPGGRLGYVYGPKEVIKEIVKLKGYLSITAPVPMQWFAYYYLSSGLKEKYLRGALEVYKKRRDAAYEAFKKYLPEAKVWKPPASMYLFPDMSAYLERLSMNDIDFTFKLAESKAVVMLPGSIFGEAGKNHIRVTFVTQPEEKLKKGIQLLADFINELEKE